MDTVHGSMPEGDASRHGDFSVAAKQSSEAGFFILAMEPFSRKGGSPRAAMAGRPGQRTSRMLFPRHPFLIVFATSWPAEGAPVGGITRNKPRRRTAR
jgi:hypothetical protein